MLGSTTCEFDKMTNANRFRSTSRLARKSRRIIFESLERRQVLSADIGPVVFAADSNGLNAPAEIGSPDPLPVFTIDQATCSAIPAPQLLPTPDSSAVDAAFAAFDSLAEGEMESPQVGGVHGYEEIGDTWLLSGTVSDDGPMSEIWVYYAFKSESLGSTKPDSSGRFSFAVHLDPGEFGFVDIYAMDGTSSMSNVVSYYICDE